MADETPVFQIQRMYLKDLSLEQPNSPQILLEQAQPQVDINLGMAAAPVADGVFEVTVTARSGEGASLWTSQSRMVGQGSGSAGSRSGVRTQAACSP